MASSVWFVVDCSPPDCQISFVLQGSNPPEMGCLLSWLEGASPNSCEYCVGLMDQHLCSIHRSACSRDIRRLRFAKISNNIVSI